MNRGNARAVPIAAVALLVAALPPLLSGKARRQQERASRAPVATHVAPRYGHSAITALAFSPDGRWLAAGTRADGGGKPSPVVLWDLTGGMARRSLAGHHLIDIYKIGLIIRHPRNENYVPKNGCPVSDSYAIAEHQISELANNHDLLVVSVYYSSVLVHIPTEVRKINVIARKSKNDYPGLRKLYNSLGITTVEFDFPSSIK